MVQVSPAWDSVPCGLRPTKRYGKRESRIESGQGGQNQFQGLLNGRVRFSRPTSSREKSERAAYSDLIFFIFISFAIRLSMVLLLSRRIFAILALLLRFGTPSALSRFHSLSVS